MAQASRSFRFFTAVTLSVALAVFWIPYSDAGGFLKDFPEAPLDTEVNYGGVFPNEMIQREAKEVLSQAPAGVYVGVGTDRAFIGAAISPHTTHLLLTDMGANVVLFNRINTALLKLARSRQDYLELRLNPRGLGHSLWIDRAYELRDFDEEARALLLNRDCFDFWQKNVVHTQKLDFQAFHFNNEVDELSPVEKSFYFKDANYLYDDQLFAKLQEMALSNRIQSVQINYKDVDAVAQLMTAIRNEGLILSVLDLSNAWEPGYIGFEKMVDVIRLSAESAANKSVLLLTETSKIKDRVDFGIDGYLFVYSGFHFETITWISDQAKLIQYFEFTRQEKNWRFLNSITDSTQINPHLI